MPSTWPTQKANQGLDATGVGIIVCARHGMKLANGVGDPHKGERLYPSSADILTSMGRDATVDKLNVSYNIACQWHKSLYQMTMSLPEEVRLDLRKKHVSFFVPKFHLPTHITPCQWKYSFDWMRGVGRTDSEAPVLGAVP
ncbi:hypothetical protein EDD15DRAFT_2178637 [Pisolithus albus]|nr:hypothetical protein EDD15DRAFT_2178637 [Pisolithus albus]